MSFAMSINPYSLLVQAGRRVDLRLYDSKHYAKDQWCHSIYSGPYSNLSRYATAGSFVTSQMVANTETIGQIGRR
jgi:hypothetical protein